MRHLIAVAVALALIGAGIFGGALAAADTSVTEVRAADLYQGKPIRWWAGKAVKNKREVLRLRASVRGLTRGAPWGAHWLERAFACIHKHEARWNGRDHATGHTYDGGLQMNLAFQRAYGKWALAAFGRAHRWPVSVQIAVAIRAYVSGRRFYPWPTRRYCGL